MLRSREIIDSHLFLSERPNGHEPQNCKSLEINGTVLMFMKSPYYT